MNNTITDDTPMPEPTPKRPNDGASKVRYTGHAQPQPRTGNFPYPKPWDLKQPDPAQPEVTPLSPASSMPSAHEPVDVKQLPPFFRSDDPYRLNPHAVESLRQTLLREIGPLTMPALSCFVQTFFADDLIVESYFRPLVRQGRVGRAFAHGGQRLEALPWREAQRAAGKSRRLNALDPYPHEKEFVGVASWVFPVGLFLLSHPSVKVQAGELCNLRQARRVTAKAVRHAINAMHGQSAPHARVMNALIGQGHYEACQPSQLSRLGTALHLSQLHLNELWVPAPGWLQSDDSDDGGDTDPDF